MKIESILDKMSKSYLANIVKSFTDENYTKDIEGYKKQILGNIDHISKPETVRGNLKKFLSNSKDPYTDGLLIRFLLITLLDSPDFAASEQPIHEKVAELEGSIIEKSKKKESFNHIETSALEVFEVLLDAALEDDNISDDELNLIKKVRVKLGISENDQFMIQATMNHFPQDNNELHTIQQMNKALNELQKCGVVFYVNQLEGSPYVIPDELKKGVKKFLGIELLDDKHKELLEVFTLPEIKAILSKLKLKTSGKKDELIERIVITGILPSETLNSLSNDRLTEICKSLPDLKSSGSKDSKIERIIEHFDSLVTMDLTESENVKETYFNIFEQLANLDMPNLLKLDSIKSQKDAENAFEKATEYIFEDILKASLVNQEGNEHADGCLKFENGELLLWDNKALMNDKEYDFPQAHVNQFRKYIQAAHFKQTRVNCFLVIVPKYKESCKINSYMLKKESGTDTDVAIISASNLKWIADEWIKYGKGAPLNLEVFNFTGLLNKDELKIRLKMFAN